MAWIQTVSGRRFELLKPTTEQIDIMDIAHSLSNQCRFNGHTKRFYSVAEHCCRVSLIVPTLEALMHDAAEAYIGDMVRPMKHLILDFGTIEHGINQAILEKFELGPETEEIKRADIVMLATERRDIMEDTSEHWPVLDGVEPDKMPIVGWTPTHARLMFLVRFATLDMLAKLKRGSH